MIFIESMFKMKILSMIDAVAITILASTGLFIIPLFPSYIQGQTQTQITIFTGPIHLGNGHTYWIRFHIPQNVKSSYLRGYVRASGSILNTVSVRLYDLDKCPRPDSTGSIDFSSCSSPLLYGDYLQAEEILKYINHPGFQILSCFEKQFTSI